MILHDHVQSMLLGELAELAEPVGGPLDLLVVTAVRGGVDANRMAAQELGGGDPAMVVFDGLRASRFIGATQVAFSPFFMGHWQLHGMPPMVDFDVNQPVPGWNAVSLTHLKAVRLGIIKEQWDIPIWADVTPPHYRIGKGIYLWHFRAAPRAEPLQ